jgi:hypothetical protein
MRRDGCSYLIEYSPDPQLCSVSRGSCKVISLLARKSISPPDIVTPLLRQVIDVRVTTYPLESIKYIDSYYPPHTIVPGALIQRKIPPRSRRSLLSTAQRSWQLALLSDRTLAENTHEVQAVHSLSNKDVR